ncbi:uncharacterized protein CCR75_005764 [Bremia lactucae]|uniref:Chromo domain-containing protein n=1 Tax=Bremia lactucae TaxID=4779 RepID=A0A976FGK9_BRELC|nr:hypothetical protein CCR75_005764 [Bremia lactucae]
MYEGIADCKERTRLHQKITKKGTLENVSTGDFVLWSRVDERLRGNELMNNRGTRVRFMIEHLITGGLFDVHGSRLKFFHNASTSVTAETLEHIGKQGIVLGWRGLQDIEDSWEPLVSMIRDVLVLIKEYVMQQKDKPASPIDRCLNHDFLTC